MVTIVERVDRIEQQNSTAVRDIKRANYKQWRANNKDKLREYNKRYWEKKAAESEANVGKANTE